MSLQEALRTVSDYNFARTAAPKWFWKLPIPKYAITVHFFKGKATDLVTTRYQHVDKAYRVLESFMQTQLSIRRKEIREEINELGAGESRRSDVFSRLVLANESDMEKLPLDAQELVR